MMVELVTVQIMVLWGGICAFALWIIHKLDKIEINQGIIKQLEHRKKHPQAFNYAQFEVWVTDILNGGNGFPRPSLGDENEPY